jgi:hypothetical protein
MILSQYRVVQSTSRRGAIAPLGDSKLVCFPFDRPVGPGLGTRLQILGIGPPRALGLPLSDIRQLQDLKIVPAGGIARVQIGHWPTDGIARPALGSVADQKGANQLICTAATHCSIPKRLTST